MDFYYSINTSTGEIKTRTKEGKYSTPVQVAYYQDFRFRVYDSGRTIIDGSLHKFWNKGEHNFNDFCIRDIKSSLQSFLDTFYINPIDAIINQIEIGVNLSIRYPISQVLDNLFYHKGQPFLWTETKTEGDYRQCKHDQYRIKFYNKTMQYDSHFTIGQELVRIEINYLGVKFRNLFKVRNLEDLQNIRFEEFSHSIKREIESILFYDWTIDHNSTRLIRYSNINTWKSFIANNQTSLFQKHRAILNGLIVNHSENVLKQIADQFHEKMMFLSMGGVSINDLCIDGIITPHETKVCAITGFGISMQRSDSRLLSHNGLEYYRLNNYKVYQALERRFLSDKWRNSSIETKIKEIAHNIRNHYYNRQHRIIENQLILF